MADEPRGAEAIRKALLELAAQMIQESERLRTMAAQAIEEARRIEVEPIAPKPQGRATTAD